MGIQIGSENIADVQVGTNKIAKIQIGTEEIWSRRLPTMIEADVEITVSIQECVDSGTITDAYYVEFHLVNYLDPGNPNSEITYKVEFLDAPVGFTLDNTEQTLTEDELSHFNIRFNLTDGGDANMNEVPYKLRMTRYKTVGNESLPLIMSGSGICYDPPL